jgi:hypothetical protein
LQGHPKANISAEVYVATNGETVTISTSEGGVRDDGLAALEQRY